MNSLEKNRMIRLVQRKIHFEEQLPLVYAGILANEVLNHFDERILDGVQKWLDGVLTEDYEVEGISLKMLREGTDASIFGALCMLNVFLRDPVTLRAAIWSLKEDGIK